MIVIRGVSQVLRFDEQGPRTVLVVENTDSNQELQLPVSDDDAQAIIEFANGVGGVETGTPVQAETETARSI